MSQELLHHFQSKLPSVEERIAAGKALRDKFPRINQGNYKPAVNRTDPVYILEEQAKTRLQELVPIRYARMLTSPFAFLRGAAAIMATDLAANGGTTGINVQACGDMHLANFGVFASAERNIIFGINDFDETLPGPWEWDLKRLVGSIVAAGRFSSIGRCPHRPKPRRVRTPADRKSVRLCAENFDRFTRHKRTLAREMVVRECLLERNKRNKNSEVEGSNRDVSQHL
jgi:Uncharacterized protein conserved in bacteria (DUF2252)